MSMTTDLPDVILGYYADTDDPIRAHIIDCPDDRESAEAWLTEARAMGLEVTAICGHKWFPERDPLKHPICEACIDEAKARLS